MGNTPQETSGTLDQPSSLDLIPAIDAENIASSYTSYAMLRPTQKSVLIAVMMDFISENIRSDTQIALDLSISRKTVYNCKVNPAFTDALTQIMPALVKAKLPKYLSMIEKHGERDWQPLRFLLEYAGLYVKTSQNLNINASIGGRMAQSMSISETVDSILIRLGELGWSDERVSGLVARFRELRAEGAF